MSALMRAEERLNNALVKLESLAMKRPASAGAVSSASDEVLSALRKENARLLDSQQQAKQRLDKLIGTLETHQDQAEG